MWCSGPWHGIRTNYDEVAPVVPKKTRLQSSFTSSSKKHNRSISIIIISSRAYWIYTIASIFGDGGGRWRWCNGKAKNRTKWRAKGGRLHITKLTHEQSWTVVENRKLRIQLVSLSIYEMKQPYSLVFLSQSSMPSYSPTASATITTVISSWSSSSSLIPFLSTCMTAVAWPGLPWSWWLWP